MPELAAFRGILYDPGAGPPERLWSPPYDVISPADRQRLVAQDPHNFVRIDLPDGDGAAKYAAAAATLRAWLDAGVLRRDEQPALYRYHQTFDAAGARHTRRGFICRMRLHRFDEGVVLPHERTLAGPKLDRLELTRATRCQLSQIFGLYSDPARATDAPFTAIEATTPALSGTTPDGVEQKLWRLTDERAVAEVVGLLADKKIYIADGHHRYETMLAYRDENRPAAPTAGSEFGTMFLCNMDDPGLIVLPTHRVLRNIAGFDAQRLLDGVRRWFVVEDAGAPPPDVLRAELARRGQQAPSFALHTGGRLYWLSLRADAVVAGSPVLSRLDVTVLHSLVIEQVLGIDRAAQAAQTHLSYIKDLSAALAEAAAPGVQAVVLMNPTRVDEVRAVADAGEVMPQKSTFFYPKIASGLVLSPAGRDDV